MKEEINLDLKKFNLFSVKEFPDRVEYTFWREIDLKIEDIELNEGQDLRFFSKNELEKMSLAFNFKIIIANFFKNRPFGSQ